MKSSKYKINISQYREFANQLEVDKNLKLKNILIDNGFLIHENIDMLKLPKIPKKIDEKYFISIKLTNLYRYINITNEMICEANNIFDIIKSNDDIINFYNTYLFSKLDKLNEYIVHDIKMYIDDLIALVWVLKQDDYPKKILVGKISTYLNNYDKTFHVFDKYISFFQNINSLDNAIKHSYKKTMDSGSIGNEKNCIVVFNSKNGNLASNDISFGVLDIIVENFNDFFKYSIDLIQELVNERS